MYLMYIAGLIANVIVGRTIGRRAHAAGQFPRRHPGHMLVIHATPLYLELGRERSCKDRGPRRGG